MSFYVSSPGRYGRHVPPESHHRDTHSRQLYHSSRNIEADAETAGNPRSPTSPPVKVFSSRSLASGGLYPAACGVVGASWFSGTNHHDDHDDNDKPGDTSNRNRHGGGDYQIQDLILKLSNVPLMKSNTCKTCQTEDVTLESDEENSPTVALQFTTKNSLQESYPPYGKPEQVASYLHNSARDDVAIKGTAIQTLRKEKKNDTSRSRSRRNVRRGRTPRYVYPEQRNHNKPMEDEISSLAATAANEVLDCHALTRPQTRRTNSIVASCMAPTIVEIPSDTRNFTAAMPGKSLLRSSFPTNTSSNNNLCLAADATSCEKGITTTSSLLCGQGGSPDMLVSSRSLFVQSSKHQRDIQYWQQRLDQAEQYQALLSPKGNYSYSRKTADLHFNLGHAYMKHAQYDLAIDHFTTAQTQWKQIHHNSASHVTVARALDAMGLAYLRQAQPHTTSKHKESNKAKKPDEKILAKAQQVLQQAFAIRFHQLGVWHVDTVETYNKLASVHLHMGELREACHSYHQVFLVRRAIFGSHHPSVAISAHSLANVYYKLQMKQESFKWYEMALKIYEEDLQLSHSHPTVAKLLKDRSRLGLDECEF